MTSHIYEVVLSLSVRKRSTKQTTHPMYLPKLALLSEKDQTPVHILKGRNLPNKPETVEIIALQLAAVCSSNNVTLSYDLRSFIMTIPCSSVTNYLYTHNTFICLRYHQ